MPPPHASAGRARALRSDATTSSTSRAVVSIWIASSAGRMLIASFSSRRRRSVASASAPIPGTLRAASRSPNRIRSAMSWKPLPELEVPRPCRCRALRSRRFPRRSSARWALAHHFTHRVVARDDRDELVDVGLANRGGHVAAVDEHATGLVEAHRVRRRELGEIIGEVEGDAAAPASQVRARYIAPVSR